MMFYYDADYKILRCPEAEAELVCQHPWHYLTQEHARASITEEAIAESRLLTARIADQLDDALKRGDHELASSLAQVL